MGPRRRQSLKQNVSSSMEEEMGIRKRHSLGKRCVREEKGPKKKHSKKKLNPPRWIVAGAKVVGSGTIPKEEMGPGRRWTWGSFLGTR